MRFWIAAALLLGLVILGVVVGPRMIDWNAYRTDIEVAAIQLSGHDVSIDGPVDIMFLPHPVLTARDVTVTGTTEAAIGFRLAANQAEVTLEIGPLLAGRPVIRDLRLKRPVLIIDDDGSRRLRAWPPRLQDWVSPFASLDLEAVAITDGKIELGSGPANEPIGLSDLSLELRTNGPSGPLEMAGLFKTKRHRFTMTATFGHLDRDGVSATKLLVEARNGVEETTTLRFNGRLTPSGGDQSARGRLTLAGPDLQHGLAAIAAATNYPSTLRSVATSQPFEVEGQIDADRAGIRAEDLQLRLSDKLGKGRFDLQLHPQTRLDLAVDLPTLRLSDNADLTGFLPLDLLSKLQVPPGEIGVSLRGLAYRDQAARRAIVKLKTGADRVTVVEQAKVELPGLIDLQFEGRLQAGEIGPRLRGRLAAVGDDLGSSLLWLSLIENRDRDGGWRSFSLECDVVVTSVEVALSAIDLRLDSSRLKGKAGLRFSERRRLALDLEVERPNLDLYLSDQTVMEAATGLAARLNGFDAEVDTRFERLNWRGVHVEEGSISAGVENGRLTLERFAAKTVGDTTLSLGGEIDLMNRAADLSAELESLHPVRALHHLELALPLTSSRLGPLALSAEMSGTFERFELMVKTRYDRGDAVVEGQAGWIDDRPWYDLTVNARHPDHQALAAQLGLAPLVPEGDAEGPLGLAGRLRHEATKPWVVSGSAKLGPTTFTGSLAHQAGALSGPFDAKLSIGSPRKDSLAPFLILTGLRIAGDWTPARWLGRLPSTGLRTAWLDKAEGTFSLASKGGLVGEGLTLNARLGDGLLYVEQLKASPWLGTLQAELSLERRRDQPFAAFAVDLDQVEAADLAEWLGVKSGISGPLDLRIEASTVGRTAYEMMAGLAGDVTIKAGPGALEGLGIPALKAILTPVAEGKGPADRSLDLPFREIEAEGTLSRGVLTLEGGRLMASSTADDQIEATLEGTADLLLWIVDLTLTATEADASPGAAPDPNRTYRVVGRPGRPEGYSPAGN